MTHDFRRKIVLTFGLIAGAILSAMMLITLPFQDQVGFDADGSVTFSRALAGEAGERVQGVVQEAAGEHRDYLPRTVAGGNPVHAHHGRRAEPEAAHRGRDSQLVFMKNT
jgi:hypothetical protein